MRRFVALAFLAVFGWVAAFALQAADEQAAQTTPTPAKKSKRQIKKEKDLTEELCDAANDFNKLIVWKGFDLASLIVEPDKRLWFLNEAEKIQPTVMIEDYKIALCQMLDTEPVRIPKHRTPLKGFEEIMPTPTPAPAVAPKPEGGARNLTPPEVEKKKKSKKKPKAQYYYGMVLVRFINQTTVPSNRVVTRLVKEYWIYHVKDKIWLVDTDLADLFEE